MGVLNHDATRDSIHPNNLVGREQLIKVTSSQVTFNPFADQSSSAHHADGHPQRLRAGGVPRGHGAQVRSQHLELPRAGDNNSSIKLPSSTPDTAGVLPHQHLQLQRDGQLRGGHQESGGARPRSGQQWQLLRNRGNELDNSTLTVVHTD